MHRARYLITSGMSFAGPLYGLAARFSFLILFFLYLISQVFVPAYAVPPKNIVLANFQPAPGAWTKHARTLLFPDSYALGTLKIDGVERLARGRVTVPAGKIVTFSPSKDFLKVPAEIDKLNPESFDRVIINAFSMEDETLSYCDKMLLHLVHQRSITHLSVDRSDTTDTGLTYAAQLPNLEKFTAFESQSEARCLKQFEGHKKLRSIEMGCCNLKEEYFKYLPSLPQLQYLNLGHTLTTDAGVKLLSGCKGLLVLNLTDNPKVTDQSIDNILQLKNLQNLSLDGTAVTFKGAIRLTPLPLARLVLPGNMTKAQCQQIIKAFPGVVVVFHTRAPEPVDSETRKLFAPLH